MTKTKITKRDNFESIKTLIAECLNSGAIDEVEFNQLTDFVDKELANLDKRAANAKKYAAKNKASGDALTEAVADVLEENQAYMTIPEIVAAVNADLGPTPQKLTYRLNKLVEAGTIKKETTSIKEEGKTARKINVYRWINTEETAE